MFFYNCRFCWSFLFRYRTKKIVKKLISLINKPQTPLRYLFIFGQILFKDRLCLCMKIMLSVIIIALYLAVGTVNGSFEFKCKEDT